MTRIPKTILWSVGILLLFGLYNACYRATSPLQGQAAPDFTLPLLEGEELHLASHQGKEIVVLNFWAVWCGFCRDEMPALAEMAQDFADQPVAVYGINLGDEPAEITGFLKSAGIELPMALDERGAVARQYQVQTIPTTLVIDRAGTIRHSHIGYTSGLVQEMTETIQGLLSEAD